MQPNAKHAALYSSVLVVNRFYLAVHVVNVRRAFTLLYRELAEVLDVDEGRYANYDFCAWLEMSELRAEEEKHAHDWIRTVSFDVQVPRVIRLLRFDKVPKQSTRFNRRNLFARDNHQCQYCSRVFPSNQLSIDHVLPRSRGGTTTWDNVVACCVRCNTRKGGRTPQEAHMKLMNKPRRPTHNPLFADKIHNPKYKTWHAFIGRGKSNTEVA
jgi:5-methylcytosine-specific restriction endonuclease McrA